MSCDKSFFLDERTIFDTQYGRNSITTNPLTNLSVKDILFAYAE